MKFLSTKIWIWLIATFICGCTSAQAGIHLQFNYDYDTSGFFAPGTEARGTLEAAGSLYDSILDDDLLAINSSPENNFTGIIQWPRTIPLTYLPNLNVPADTVIIYVNAYELSYRTLGEAYPGTFSISYNDNDWVVDTISRGEGGIGNVMSLGATDYAPWGGTIAINTDFTWNLNHTTEPVGNEYDLYTVLLHEINHILGIGTADSWKNLIVDDQFIGTTAVAEHGGPVNTIGPHWDLEVVSKVFRENDPQYPASRPELDNAMRLHLTDLDVAALDDIGWDINYVPAPSHGILLLSTIIMFAVIRRHL